MTTMQPMEVEGSSNETKQQSRFQALQHTYLVVYLLVMGADWLQGPYLYKLYQSYGLDLVRIALLFLTGFVSGAVAGTALGGLADSWGRRRFCLAFCGITAVSIVLRLVNNYTLLLTSHVLSGTAAALQYSVFEAWYVSEHISRGFPSEWRARTFAVATFLNGLVAIVAGVVANTAVNMWGFSAPFLISMALLGVASSTITLTWSENYGESSEISTTKRSLTATILDGCRSMWNDTNIMILGAAQTVFECAMYIFVLLYTPAVENTAAIHDSDEIPLGYMFSTMMFAVMLGSLSFQTLEQRASLSSSSSFLRWFTPNKLLATALAVASCSFALMVYSESSSLSILIIAFHIFEFSTGLYYPSISSLKAETIPEETRAAIMTLLRIPMNLGVGLIMWHVNDMSTSMMFALCATMTLLGFALVSVAYRRKMQSNS
ncbi:hypothetical protein VTP01DRAFT_1122 [Rhizomucor pusillus]|uniref:uncharacterized protein n=1 Tax=Rhizomucor pusillus TaxID=4840 RepID=UPI0037440054